MLPSQGHSFPTWSTMITFHTGGMDFLSWCSCCEFFPEVNQVWQNWRNDAKFTIVHNLRSYFYECWCLERCFSSCSFGMFTLSENVRPFTSHVVVEIRWCSVSYVSQVYQKWLSAIHFVWGAERYHAFMFALEAIKHLVQVPWVWSAVADETSNLVAKSSPSDMKVLSQGLQDNPEWYPAPQQMDQHSGDNLDFWRFVIKTSASAKLSS